MDLDCPDSNNHLKLISCLTKVIHWLIHRIRSNELVVFLLTKKQAEGKFGRFGFVHKKLKHFFQNSLAHPSLQSYQRQTYLANSSSARYFPASLSVAETIKEWLIPYEDLHFEKSLSIGQNGTIYKGHWHGEELIHTFKDAKDDDVSNFWDTIAQLCMVRHENIQIFMGACVDSPNLSVITSMRKGPSLLEHIHVKHQVISPPNRINIARQIAQAMGYLHAKGIIHKRLQMNR